MSQIEEPPKNSVVLYLVVAYGFTWLLWLLPLLVAFPRGWVMPSPDNYPRLVAEGFAGVDHLLLAAVFTAAVYGPLLGAMAATTRDTGSRGVRDLLARTVDPKVAPRWYLTAIAVAVLLTSVPIAAASLTGNLVQPVLDSGTRLTWFLPLLLLQMLTSGLGEEPGWRGYLLPSLRERFGPASSVWLLGLAWAAWHYPLTAMYTLAAMPSGMPAVVGVVTVVVALLSQTIGLIAMTYIYAWLYERTTSIFLMIFFHALTNTIPFLLPPPLGMWALVIGLFPWVVVLVLWLSARPHFPHKRPSHSTTGTHTSS